LLASDELQKRKLLEIKAVSQDEYDVAKSQLLVNQADRQLLEAQIAKTEIYAPFTGKVGLRAVSVGNYVASNTLIATIQQLDPVKIEFDVPEKYSSQIKPGLELSFTTDASDSTFTAKIYAIESAITTETRTLKVRALCPNPKGMLNPGKISRCHKSSVGSGLNHFRWQFGICLPQRQSGCYQGKNGHPHRIRHPDYRRFVARR
jgi:membrane fusion protein (multidrug efflux system)